MGRLRPKNAETVPKSDAVSAPPSDIFKSLFGDVPDENAAVSIFSDNNPFLRKPQEQAAASVGDSNVVEVKKKKRGKDGEAPETPLEAKKSKKEKLEILNKESADWVSEKDPILGGDNKKKRKRDELEKEYEVRKYGGGENVEEEEKRLVGKVGTKRKSVDNPEDLMISKEGFDDESKLLRTVFVGNLPLNVKKKALIKEFSKFGEVESVRIRSVPVTDTKKPRKGAVIKKLIPDSADSVNAYLVFKTEESALASLSHNMAVVGEHHIRVDRACPPRKKIKGDSTPLYDHKRTLFVGNLPFDVKDEEVYQLFCGINSPESGVEAVRVIRDPHNNVGKGFAYILFKTKEAANLVCKKRNLKLRDRELRVSHSKPDSTPSKRSNPSPAAKFPSKRLAVDSRSGDDHKRVNTYTNMSYQGLRASKSGVQKKVAQSSRPDKINPKPVKVGKERKEKRPSVAARKAKALKDPGALKQAGIKRKMDSRTPDSSFRNKKMKKSR
ncbi:hypothetical protein UlMin_001170 [Ulmus minor]